MHFVSFELSQQPATVSAAEEYFGTLTPLVQQSPGFISFAYYTSPVDSKRGVLVAQFEDEKAIMRWQQHPLHLDIQKKARAHIFDDYRIRIGPEVDADEVETEGHKANIVMLYERKLMSETVIPNTLRDLISEEAWDGFAKAFVDESVYHDEEKMCRLWISAWTDGETAKTFVQAAELVGDVVHYYRAVRDYTRFKRGGAPRNASDNTCPLVEEKAQG